MRHARIAHLRGVLTDHYHPRAPKLAGAILALCVVIALLYHALSWLVAQL